MLGCDYFKGVPNYGIKRAHYFIKENINLQTIDQLANKLNEDSKIAEKDLKPLKSAHRTFVNHIVFDPIRQVQTRLSEIISICAIPNEHWVDDRFFHGKALDHAKGHVGRRDCLDNKTSVNRDNIQISLPAGSDLSNVYYRQADIWLWRDKDLDEKIPKEEMDKCIFKLTEFSTAKTLPTTQSDYFSNSEYSCKKLFKQFTMGGISDARNIFPFEFILQEDLNKIVCHCGELAEERAILFKDNEQTIYSNADEFVGGYFYVCPKSKCDFIYIKRAVDYESPLISACIIADDIDEESKEIDENKDNYPRNKNAEKESDDEKVSDDEKQLDDEEESNYDEESNDEEESNYDEESNDEEESNYDEESNDEEESNYEEATEYDEAKEYEEAKGGE
jgi:hypothetical protein